MSVRHQSLMAFPPPWSQSFFLLHFCSGPWALPQHGGHSTFTRRPCPRRVPVCSLWPGDEVIDGSLRERHSGAEFGKRPKASPSPAPSVTSLHPFMLQFLHLLVERVIRDTLLSECHEHLCTALGDAGRGPGDFVLPSEWESETPAEGLKITEHIFSQ